MGRLREPKLDALESFGLPSKGDERLLRFENQERYFQVIVDREAQFRQRSRSDDDEPSLADELASVTISEAATPAPAPAPTPEPSVKASDDQARLLLAMRKLREGIVASGRADAFAVRAYSFCIRAAILARQMPSCHPALLHLLRRLHARTRPSAADRHAFVGYLILDMACRQADYGAAFRARRAYRYQDARMDGLLQAMVHGDYHTFWRMEATADPYQAKLMEYAGDRMRRWAIACLGRAYFTVDAAFVAREFKMQAHDVIQAYNLPWQHDGHTVIIRTRTIKDQMTRLAASCSASVGSGAGTERKIVVGEASATG
ncbi:MAG: hypothetical protein M1826_004819 [Phylliscum demangeonii]|nr:MAG: hypothetical protein M1826_004819 [Phylliscum demangeonii]